MLFLEEMIIRRELSDNFCEYEPEYDQFEGFHAWSQKTLNEHRNDEREYIYPLGQFEAAETHDDLWNAAQNEMKITGKNAWLYAYVLGKENIRMDPIT
ncbi:hypothetical protein Ct9H90mP29_19310 [bacterium]|nr:MAG: hypothetical protein Ct9H90mP29_19310 [bacterium]